MFCSYAQKSEHVEAWIPLLKRMKVLEEKNIRTHRGWPFFLGTGSQTVICVRFPLGTGAGWLSHPRLLANGNRKFIMTRLLIEFASSFCCSHSRLGLLVVSGFANDTQNVPEQQIYTNRAYFLLFFQPQK